MTRRRFLLDLTAASAGLAAAALWASRREPSCAALPPEPRASVRGDVALPPATPTPTPQPAGGLEVAPLPSPAIQMPPVEAKGRVAH